MVEITHTDVLLAGDIGGQGISRFWWQRQDATTPLVADCNAAASALHTMLGSLTNSVAVDVTYTVQSDFELLDHATGAVQAILQATSIPSPITGGGSGNYAAGVGGRLNWKTGSVHNRRFIRGANFITPYAASAYDTTGQVSASTQSSGLTAILAYLTAMNSAGLEAIIWHRPPTGTFSGGAVGLISAGAISPVPGSVRSRRVLR